jgi:hypothetical protein
MKVMVIQSNDIFRVNIRAPFSTVTCLVRWIMSIRFLLITVSRHDYSRSFPSDTENESIPVPSFTLSELSSVTDKVICLKNEDRFMLDRSLFRFHAKVFREKVRVLLSSLRSDCITTVVVLLDSL